MESGNSACSDRDDDDVSRWAGGGDEGMGKVVMIG
jgi:hypothetical protein